MKYPKCHRTYQVFNKLEKYHLNFKIHNKFKKVLKNQIIYLKYLHRRRLKTFNFLQKSNKNFLQNTFIWILKHFNCQNQPRKVLKKTILFRNIPKWKNPVNPILKEVLLFKWKNQDQKLLKRIIKTHSMQLILFRENHQNPKKRKSILKEIPFKNPMKKNNKKKILLLNTFNQVLPEIKANKIPS